MYILTYMNIYIYVYYTCICIYMYICMYICVCVPRTLRTQLKEGDSSFVQWANNDPLNLPHEYLSKISVSLHVCMYVCVAHFGYECMCVCLYMKVTFLGLYLRVYLRA